MAKVSSIKQIAEHFGVSEEQVRAWRESGCGELVEAPFDLENIRNWCASAFIAEPANKFHLEIRELEREKIKAEIAQLKANKQTRWITPTAMAALLPLLAGFGIWISSEVKQYNEAYMALQEMDKWKEDRKNTFAELQTLIALKQNYRDEANKLEAEKMEVESNLAALQKKEDVARRRNKAISAIEEHSGPIRRIQDDKVTLHIKLNYFKLGDEIHQAFETLLKIGIDDISIVELQGGVDKLSELVQTLKVEEIKELRLVGTRISDAGLVHLAQLQNLKRLVLENKYKLSEGSSGQTYSTLLMIADGRPRVVSPSAWAKMVRRDKTGAVVSHLGVMQLQAQLPGCKIEYTKPSLDAALRHRGISIRGDAGLYVKNAEAVIDALRDVIVPDMDGSDLNLATTSIDLSLATDIDFTVLAVLPALKEIDLPRGTVNCDGKFTYTRTEAVCQI